MTWQYIAIRASSKVKKVDRTKCRWECGTTVILMHCWWECKMLQPLLKKKKDEQFLKKKQYVYIIEANHSTLKSALKRNNYHPNKDLCTKFLKIGQKTNLSQKMEWSCSVVSDSLRPHGLEPTRLLHPWNFPGKSIGVCCHVLLHSKDEWIANCSIFIQKMLRDKNRLAVYTY